MGFGPQLVDLDGDGVNDIISGNWVFQIIWFRGDGRGGFAAGEPLKDAHGKVLHVDYGVHAFAVDWDADGDLDLLAGTVDRSEEGNVYLIRNGGATGANAFGLPQRLTAGDQPIRAIDGDAAPLAADWNNDGKLDLVLGCGDGSVIWYRNVGTRQAPAFSSFETLVPPPQPDDERGTRAKPCVVDWNGDGRQDLIIGDFGKPFAKVLSKEEQQWRDEARRQQADFLKTWASRFQEYRRLLSRSSLPAETNDSLQSELTRLRAELVRLNSIRSRYHEQEQALQPGQQYHGRIWVFLRDKTENRDAAKSAPVARDIVPIDEPTVDRPVVFAASIHPVHAAPGAEVTLTVRGKTAAKWHIYAVGTAAEVGVPTKLTLELPSGITAHGDWEVQNPEAQSTKEAIAIYQGEFALRRSLRIAPDLSSGPLKVKCRVSYQPCDDVVCLRPTTADVSASLEVKSK
jgi:hypothetical protein